MPEESNSCKFCRCEFTMETLEIFCEFGLKANLSCLLSGRVECPKYEKGLVYTSEEIKEEFELE